MYLFRSPGSHCGDDSRWEVSPQPAGSDLHEITSAHYGQHEQLPRGKTITHTHTRRQTQERTRTDSS